MDDIKNELKNESSTKNSLKKVKSNEIIENKNNSNSETKQHRELENTITAMLDQVMEDPDDTYSTSNHVINSLQFNDDESIEDDFVDPKINRNFIHSHFDRSNKRLKTVINYPVNMPNMPIMNVNPFSYGNNISSMRAPSFGFDSSMNYNNINNFNENNYIGHKSSNNLFNNIYLDQSFNNQMNNNANMNTFLRSSNPYSKTAIYHYPLNLFNNNFGHNFIKNAFPNNLPNNLNNIPNNFSENNSINNNVNNVNNNNINNVNINNMPEKDYKRKESRRKTYPSFNYILNEKVQQDLQNFNNNNQLMGNYNNQMLYQNNNNNSFNQNNSNEYLIFQLKFNLEKTLKIDHYIYGLIKGKFFSIIKNHKGSKIFQKYLKSTHSDILHQIFMELKPNLEDLITDPYANYFCKRFFTYLNQKDRTDFLKDIEKSMVKLSSNSIGTYPIQTIIEHVGSKNEKIIIVNALKDNVKELAVDPFGSHVLEKLLTCFEEEYVSFIYNYIVDNFLELANNNNGICIVKKILTFTHKKTIHDKLKILIKENGLQLISHPYANFVIQIVVECWSDYKDILALYDKKYYNLSLEKYASNVVERCIEKDEDILNNYINEIIESNRIYEVMRSNYGNYVIQKAIKLSKGENKKKLVFNAAKDINKLNDAKLILKWKSILSPHINELTPEQFKYLDEQKYFNIVNSNI
jgi:hypothetical protein